MKVVGPCIAFTAFFLFALLKLTADAPKPIELHVSPRIAFAPASLAIQVRVHASPEDRWINIVTDSGEFYRRSDFSIEPDRTLYRIEWRALPAGEYDVIAVIGHGDVVTGRDRQSIQIASNGP